MVCGTSGCPETGKNRAEKSIEIRYRKTVVESRQKVGFWGRVRTLADTCSGLGGPWDEHYLEILYTTHNEARDLTTPMG